MRILTAADSSHCTADMLILTGATVDMDVFFIYYSREIVKTLS